MTAEMGHNLGVSPEIAAEAMRRALAPWQDRRAEFERKANTAVVDCQDAAAAAIDFVRMARALAEKADGLIVEVQGPYAEAAAAAKAVGQQFIESVESSVRKVEGALKAYNEERKLRAAAQQAEQERAEARLREAAGAPAQIPTPAPSRRRKAAPIRTDLGGLMVEQDRWTVEVVDVRKVPVRVLRSPKVMEAIRIVARDFMKNGDAVPGCKRVDVTTTLIR